MQLTLKIIVTVNVVAAGTLYVAWRMLPEGSEMAPVLREAVENAELAPPDSLRPGKLLGYLHVAVRSLDVEQARAQRATLLFTIALSIVGMNAAATFILLLQSQADNDREEKKA